MADLEKAGWWEMNALSGEGVDLIGGAIWYYLV
jgi:hypothetical protein